VHCFQVIWFNKRTHPNDRRIGCWLSTKWVLASCQLVACALVQPIKELSSAAGLCAGRNGALIRQLADDSERRETWHQENAINCDNYCEVKDSFC